MERQPALLSRTIRSTPKYGGSMKDVSHIHRKIEKAGITTVASVNESGLVFEPGASAADQAAAWAIFNAYTENDSDKFNIAKRMIEIQALLDGVKQVEKDITIPNGLKTGLEAEYAALKTEFLA